ncbi:hypothetical protein FOL47_004657 [Perkinsus chesapeaki]|uniref:JmjC domain-containing protein n=1 Tax=Perkinsus chesapeaki TaxID=330153 RepID=A0A7J6M1A1_PERCH|nr:hypothetical protein FOL47_004657 [Perkinsus chesapeaki]
MRVDSSPHIGHESTTISPTVAVSFELMRVKGSYNTTGLDPLINARDVENDDDTAFSMEDSTELDEEYGTHFRATVVPTGDSPVEESSVDWQGNRYVLHQVYEVSFVPYRAGIYLMNTTPQLFMVKSVLVEIQNNTNAYIPPQPTGSSLILSLPTRASRVGETIAFEILLRDAYHNDLDASLAISQLLGTAHPSSDILGTVVAVRIFDPSVDGNTLAGYSTITRHGPFPLPLIPGTISPAKCRAYWPTEALQPVVVAGKFNNFVLIDIFDAYGNHHEDVDEVESIEAYLQLQEGPSCSISNDKIVSNHSQYLIRIGCTTASVSAQLEIGINGDPVDATGIAPLPILPSAADRTSTACSSTSGGIAPTWAAGTQYNWTCIVKDSFGNPINREILVGREIRTVYGARLHMKAMIEAEYLIVGLNSTGNTSVRSSSSLASSTGLSTTGVHASGEFLFTPRLTRTGTYSLAVWLRQRGGVLVQYFRNSDFTSLVHRWSLVRHKAFPPIPYTVIAYTNTEEFLTLRLNAALEDETPATIARSVRMIGSLELPLGPKTEVGIRAILANANETGVRVEVGPLGASLLEPRSITDFPSSSTGFFTLIDSLAGVYEATITIDMLNAFLTTSPHHSAPSWPDISAYSGYIIDIIIKYWLHDGAKDDQLQLHWCKNFTNTECSPDWEPLSLSYMFYPYNIAAASGDSIPLLVELKNLSLLAVSGRRLSLPLERFLDHIDCLYADGAANGSMTWGFLADYVADKLDLEELDKQLGDLLGSNIWLGPSSTVSRLHYDAVDTLFFQLVGKKRFSLLEPSEFESLVPEGSAPLLKAYYECDETKLFSPPPTFTRATVTKEIVWNYSRTETRTDGHAVVELAPGDAL